MAARRPFVLVYCASSNPTPAELAAHEGREDARYRNSKFFKVEELEYRDGMQVVSAVYTNNPDVRAAYEALKGQRVRLGGQWVTLNVPVRPIAPPVAVASALPDAETLNAMTIDQLVDEFGVDPKDARGRRRRKADLIQEILEG